MKRKVLVTILVICLILSNITLVFANGGVWSTIDVLVNGMVVKVNGQTVNSNNLLYNGTTYLPLRAVSEALGANVNYIKETQTADITLNAPKTNSNAIDYASIDIASVYIEFEQLSDLIDSRQEYADSIFSSYVSGYYTINEMNKMLEDYNDRLAEDNEYINNYLELLAEYLNQFEGNQDLTKDFSLVKSYLKDIEKMETNKIKLLENIVLYGQDDTIVERFSSIETAIGNSCFAINDITSSNYFSITNNILSGEAYVPASQVLDYQNSYFITVPTNINLNIQTPSTVTQDTTNVSTYYNFPLHLYSYDGKEYLGKLITNKYDSDSVWNEYGTYGGKYQTKSIWNEYGDYGSKYSSKSSFNKYATEPPKIVDNKGSFVGYLTINEYMTDGYSLEVIRQFLIDNYQ